jgi:hypothetical protein
MTLFKNSKEIQKNTHLIKIKIKIQKMIRFILKNYQLIMTQVNYFIKQIDLHSNLMKNNHQIKYSSQII